MTHRIRTLSIIVVGSLATAGIATAAVGGFKPCHPDLPGTRSLTVTGAVTAYRFAASGSLNVSVRGAGIVRWNYKANPTASISGRRAIAPRSAAVAQKLVATQGDRTVRVVFAPKGVDRPDMLDVYDRLTGRRIASWPLIERPGHDRTARVALYGGIAILSGADRGALYAVRISDGHTAEIAIAHADDRPIIGPEGVVYQDDKYVENSRYHLPANEVALKLVPLASVKRQLRLADRQIVTHGRISAISMDGQRVVFAVHDPAGRCDRVMFWVPQWHFLRHLTHPSGPTCLPAHAPGGITSIAIADARVIWTTKYGETTRVLAASAIGCVEWLVARPVPGGLPVAALAGDGNVLAYALRGAGSAGRPGTVGLVPAHWRAKVVSTSPTQVSGMSVDSKRIATLYRNGTVTVMTASGSRVNSFAVGAARAVALRRDTVAVLRSGEVAIYNATTGALEHSWPVPADARTVDLVYGIAVVVGGGDVLALNIHTGRSARLLHVRGRVAAQVDSPGAVVQFNSGDVGHVRFIPMSAIEARTR